MSIRLITDNIGRIHVEVTLKTRISSAAGSLLYRLGICDSPEPMLQATGRAEVLDITGDGSDVRFLNYVCNKINDSDDLKNMKTIYLNCENGVSGDMVLNALVGLTEDPDAVRANIERVSALIHCGNHRHEPPLRHFRRVHRHAGSDGTSGGHGDHQLGPCFKPYQDDL